MKITRPLLVCLLFGLMVPASQAADDLSKLSKDLVALDGDKVKKAKDIDLGSKKYVAFYYSAHWCPPCRAFTPKLAEWYKEMKEEHGDKFELVFVSSDRSEEDMEEYIKWGKMTFPALDYGERKEESVQKHAARGIPYMVVLDLEGNEVLGKGKEDWVHPGQLLGDFEKLLKKS